MKNKKYLITGGTGFIGSALVKELVRKGYQVKVFDNNIRGDLRRLNDVKDKIELIEGDIRNFSEILSASKNVDSIIHLAYINGTEYFYKMPELVLDVGVKGMLNVVDACKKHNIKELILSSSSEVYQTPDTIPTPENIKLTVPDPMNPRYSYGGGKIISELITINYGRKFLDKSIIFRPHNVYGPDMGWEHVIPQFILKLKQLISKNNSGKINFPIQGSGEETRAFVFIDDFVKGLATVLEKGEHLNIYNIGTMDEVKISEVAHLVSRYFKKEIEIIPGEKAKGGTNKRCPDIAKLKRLGFSPEISLEEGLNRTIKWYTENSEKIRKLENE